MRGAMLLSLETTQERWSGRKTELGKASEEKYTQKLSIVQRINQNGTYVEAVTGGAIGWAKGR